MTDIYIISGFLGAGKTTLIQKLLADAFRGKRVALIENDFGEASVDAALLKESGFQVKELSSGCICCTLTGDFVSALASLLKSCSPEIILIEPSGVGKLSDVERACRDEKLAQTVRVAGCITVVDVKRCERYLENFGEFFEDQIRHADTVLFSRTADCPERIPQAEKAVRTLNPHAVLFTGDWDSLGAEEILQVSSEHVHENEVCACHAHHTHEDGCCHTADESFDTLTLRFGHAVELAEISGRLAALDSPQYGTILRAKGILACTDGSYTLQYLPGDLKIEEANAHGSELSIIGRDLAKEKLTALFAGL